MLKPARFAVTFLHHLYSNNYPTRPSRIEKRKKKKKKGFGHERFFEEKTRFLNRLARDGVLVLKSPFCM